MSAGTIGTPGNPVDQLTPKIDQKNFASGVVGSKRQSANPTSGVNYNNGMIEMANRDATSLSPYTIGAGAGNDSAVRMLGEGSQPIVVGNGLIEGGGND